MRTPTPNLFWRIVLQLEDQTDDSCRVLLASIKACGVGLNLTKARHAIFTELSWNPFGEELQARQRIHRIGQSQTTWAIYLLGNVSPEQPGIDDYVCALQEKMSSARSVLGTYQPTQTLWTLKKKRIASENYPS